MPAGGNAEPGTGAEPDPLIKVEGLAQRRPSGSLTSSTGAGA